jgi:hypothetical protein
MLSEERGMAAPAARRVTIYVLLLLTVLLAVTLVIITSVRSANESANQLAVGDPAKIDYIKISGENEEVVLTRSGRRNWLVNGEEGARPSAVNMLLRTLASLEVKSPVSDDFFSQATRNGEVLPVSVEVKGNGRMLTAFSVYLLSGDPDGNIIQKERGNGYFIAHLPGYDINPAIQFISGERYWRPFTIFEINPSDILSVEVDRRLPAEESFLIESAGEKLMLTINGVAQEMFDTAAVRQYISWYAFVPFESWYAQSGDNETDSIISADPLVTIRVIEKVNRESEGMNQFAGSQHKDEPDGSGIGLYLHPEGERADDLENRGKQHIREHFVRFWSMVSDDGSTDSNRLWGEKNRSGELFIVTYFDIDPLIIGGDKFISE